MTESVKYMKTILTARKILSLYSEVERDLTPYEQQMIEMAELCLELDNLKRRMN